MVMVRDPFNITLKSTKRDIITVLLSIFIIGFGIFMMNQKGFGIESTIMDSNAPYVDGFHVTRVLYSANTVYAIIIFLVSLGMIIIRKDLLGVVCGVLLLIFLNFGMVIGYDHRSGGIVGINEEKNLTVLTLALETISNN